MKNLEFLSKKIFLKKILIYFSLYFFLPKDLVCQFKKFKEVNKNKCKNIIDIGANVGNWTLLYMSLFKNCNFFLIEADHSHGRSIKLISKYFYLGALYSKAIKKVFFFTNKYSGTGNSFYKENTSIKFKKKFLFTNTLDKITKNFFYKKKYDIIKIDTQGSELDILNGANRTLKKTKMIIIEINIFKYNQNKVEYYDIFKFLDKKGFKFKNILNESYKLEQLNSIDCLFSKK
jgi:FkbM family methyltransferase